MGKKKRKEDEVLIWCYYCDKICADEATLVVHQKNKHFKCPECHKKLNSSQGLGVHMYQVHKKNLVTVPGAKPGRDSVEVEIFGMAGIPPGATRGGGNDEEAAKRQRNDEPEFPPVAPVSQGVTFQGGGQFMPGSQNMPPPMFPGPGQFLQQERPFNAPPNQGGAPGPFGPQMMQGGPRGPPGPLPFNMGMPPSGPHMQPQGMMVPGQQQHMMPPPGQMRPQMQPPGMRPQGFTGPPMPPPGQMRPQMSGTMGGPMGGQMSAPMGGQMPPRMGAPMQPSMGLGSAPLFPISQGPPTNGAPQPLFPIQAGNQSSSLAPPSLMGGRMARQGGGGSGPGSQHQDVRPAVLNQVIGDSILVWADEEMSMEELRARHPKYGMMNRVY